MVLRCGSGRNRWLLMLGEFSYRLSKAPEDSQKIQQAQQVDDAGGYAEQSHY